VGDLEITIQRTGQVIDQTRTRLAGQTPSGTTRLVRLHDPDARPIVKGRLGKPVEFRYKAQVVDSPDGVVLDHQVWVGNPADAPLLVPAVGRVIHRVGRVPTAATADRSCGEAAVDDALGELGVAQVAIPPQGHAQPGSPGRGAHPTVPAAGQVAHRVGGAEVCRSCRPASAKHGSRPPAVLGPCFGLGRR
jgi:IS5 family transposase